MSVLALDIGGTNLRSAFVEGLDVEAERRVEADFSQLTRRAGQRAEEELLAALLEHISRRLEERPVEAVAAGMPGFISRRGVVLASPNLPGVENLELARRLEEGLGRPVVVANDGLAAAYGAWLLEGRRPPSLAILTLGTGVGGGLVLDRRPVVGDGGTAMEMGHLPAVDEGHPCGCGKRGCLEQYASASAVRRLDQEAGGGGRDAAELAEAARRGEELARRLFREAGGHLGRAVATLILIADVRAIRFGGGMSAAWDLLVEGFQDSLNRHLIPPLRGLIDAGPVEPGQIDRVGLIGAAGLAGRPSD